MAQRADADAPDHTLARRLCAANIGELVRFRVMHPVRETVAVVTGELRQLSMNGGEVTVYIGVGAEEEHTLGYDTIVIRRPAEDYSDVKYLLGNDPEYAQFGLR